MSCRSLKSQSSRSVFDLFAEEEGNQCYQGLSRLLSSGSTSSIGGSDLLTLRNALMLCFGSSHLAATELRKVTFLCLSSLQSIPSLGSIQTVRGEPHNKLNDPSVGFSGRVYREFSSKPMLALYCIHYCVRGLQNLLQLSRERSAGSVRDIYYVSKDAGELMKRLMASRDEGSKEKIVQAIEELRSSRFAYAAGADRIPELCQKLAQLTPDVVRGIQDKDNLKDQLAELIETVESYVVRVRSLINHHFLVLEMHDVLDPESGKVDKYFIVAEKLSDPAGVHITIETKFEERYKQRGAVLFEMKCGLRKLFALGSLETILLNCSMDYRLADSCCWDYAVNTSKALLRACVDLPGTSIEERQRLQTEARNVQANCGFHSVYSFLNIISMN